MENRQWKYKIGSGKMPVVLMFIMSVLFGGLAAWLYSTNNGAFIFCAILTAIMFFVFILTIYRLLFYKVLIGTDGFYYQTGIGNGRYYNYSDIEKAWISSGTAQNGHEEQYCNFVAYGERAIRFHFFSSDEKGINYLIKRANAESLMKSVHDEKDDYLIDGKDFGKTKVVVGIVVLAIFAFLNFLIVSEIGFHAMLIPEIVIGIALCWTIFVDYVFFKVRICKDSFYCRTSPFNGCWYKYSDIAHCKEIKRVVRHYHRGRGSLNRTYYYFFEFTDKSGKKHKFRFAKPLHEREVNILKERIEQASS